MSTLKAVPTLVGLLVITALIALGLWATGAGQSTGPLVLHDSSGGTWRCVQAGTYQGHLVVHCDGQERLDPTGNDGVRCYLIGEGTVACSNLRGGTKDLTRG